MNILKDETLFNDLKMNICYYGRDCCFNYEGYKISTYNTSDIHSTVISNKSNSCKTFIHYKNHKKLLIDTYGYITGEQITYSKEKYKCV